MKMKLAGVVSTRSIHGGAPYYTIKIDSFGTEYIVTGTSRSVSSKIFGNTIVGKSYEITATKFAGVLFVNDVSCIRLIDDIKPIHEEFEVSLAKNVAESIAKMDAARGAQICAKPEDEKGLPKHSEQVPEKETEEDEYNIVLTRSDISCLLHCVIGSSRFSVLGVDSLPLVQRLRQALRDPPLPDASRFVRAEIPGKAISVEFDTITKRMMYLDREVISTWADCVEYEFYDH